MAPRRGIDEFAIANGEIGWEEGGIGWCGTLEFVNYNEPKCLLEMTL
jgi:hypothetical protein